MSTGNTYGSDELKPAVRRKGRTFFVPLLFFALGALSAFGYFSLVRRPERRRYEDGVL